MTQTISRQQRAGLVVPGAICGDIIGSAYEFRSTKDLDFELFRARSRFTDDTVCTIAVADALINGKPFDGRLQEWCRRYHYAGYGGLFRRWIWSEDPQPYNSWGNGSAMRVSAAGAIAHSKEEVLKLAKASAEVTHNHPEGIKGAQATALAIFMALEGASKEEIKSETEDSFGYDLSRRYCDIQPGYRFEVSCQGSVPEAIICFLESEDYESAVRMAVALGGDADTQGAITGGIAAAYYGEIPATILSDCLSRLPEDITDVIADLNRYLGN